MNAQLGSLVVLALMVGVGGFVATATPASAICSGYVNQPGTWSCDTGTSVTVEGCVVEIGTLRVCGGGTVGGPIQPF